MQSRICNRIKLYFPIEKLINPYDTVARYRERNKKGDKWGDTGTGYRGRLGIQGQDTGKVRDRILRQDIGIGKGTGYMDMLWGQGKNSMIL